MEAPNQGHADGSPYSFGQAETDKPTYAENGAGGGEIREMDVEDSLVVFHSQKDIDATFNGDENGNDEDFDDRRIETEFSDVGGERETGGPAEGATTSHETEQLQGTIEGELQDILEGQLHDIAAGLFSALGVFLDEAAAVQKDFQQVSEQAFNTMSEMGSMKLIELLRLDRGPSPQVQTAVLGESDRLDKLQPTVEEATRSILAEKFEN